MTTEAREVRCLLVPVLSVYRLIKRDEVAAPTDTDRVKSAGERSDG